MTIPSVATLLKQETAVAHGEAENLLSPRLTGIQSFTDYAQVLRTFYGYFAPLQKIIHRFISADELEDIEQRRHASLIFKDLKAIGALYDEIELCKDLPLIENRAQAFGALYVLEGSTLGGRMISKMLMKNSRVSFGEEHLNFFNGYGIETAGKWKTFLQSLNHQTEEEKIIAAANETFLCFRNWIKHTLYHEHSE